MVITMPLKRVSQIGAGPSRRDGATSSVRLRPRNGGGSVSLADLTLVSALHKASSRPALADIPDCYFDPAGLRLLNWLRDFARQHNAFPMPSTFRRETGVALLVCKEPLGYYVDRARQKALYKGQVNLFGAMRHALEEQKPDEAARIAHEFDRLDKSLRPDDRHGGRLDAPTVASMVMDDYQDACRTLDRLRGVTTGWQYADEQMGGHQKGDLNTFVGRPGVGKTTILLYQAHAAWRAGHSVLFFSNELAAKQIGRRLLGIEGNVNPKYLRDGVLTTRAMERMRCAIHALSNGSPFEIVPGGFRNTVPRMRALVEERMPDIIFVDAAYLLSPEQLRNGAEGRREKVSDVVEELKKLALEWDRPVVLTVQFNRQAKRPKPRNADRDDGSYNPLAHLSLDVIGETDVIGQVSSVVVGIDFVDHPHERDQRQMGFLKGREGMWALENQL